tara:strand:- start:417 stop:638 length:222 start_codon:yes stop_codon:yes gene_type:complete
MNKRKEKIAELLSTAQDYVVGTRLDDLYFDFCYYHITGLYENLDDEDLDTIEKSAKSIIKMAKLDKEIKSILY